MITITARLAGEPYHVHKIAAGSVAQAIAAFAETTNTPASWYAALQPGKLIGFPKFYSELYGFDIVQMCATPTGLEPTE